jgi:hypothetical protein
MYLNTQSNLPLNAPSYEDVVGTRIGVNQSGMKEDPPPSYQEAINFNK